MTRVQNENLEIRKLGCGSFSDGTTHGEYLLDSMRGGGVKKKEARRNVSWVNKSS